MLDTRVTTALTVRVFEIWTHIEDLCRTLRRDPPQLDAARLHLMSHAAVHAIPLGMLLGNIDGGQHTARIVLTGRGGGVWDQPLQLGLEAGEPSVTIVADAVEFCRLAAQRIAPADLDAEVDGPWISPSPCCAAPQSSPRRPAGCGVFHAHLGAPPHSTGRVWSVSRHLGAPPHSTATAPFGGPGSEIRR